MFKLSCKGSKFPMATKGRYIYYHCLFPAVLFVCLSFQILKHRKIWHLYHMLCLTGITFRFSLWQVGGRPWDGEKDKFDEEVQNPAGEIELYWLHTSRIPFPLADYVSFFSTENFFIFWISDEVNIMEVNDTSYSLFPIHSCCCFCFT